MRAQNDSQIVISCILVEELQNVNDRCKQLLITRDYFLKKIIFDIARIGWNKIVEIMEIIDSFDMKLLMNVD